MHDDMATKMSADSSKRHDLQRAVNENICFLLRQIFLTDISVIKVLSNLDKKSDISTLVCPKWQMSAPNIQTSF